MGCLLPEPERVYKPCEAPTNLPEDGIQYRTVSGVQLILDPRRPPNLECIGFYCPSFHLPFIMVRNLQNSRIYPKLKPIFFPNTIFRKLLTRKSPNMSLDVRKAQSFSVVGIKIPNCSSEFFSLNARIFFLNSKISSLNWKGFGKKN